MVEHTPHVLVSLIALGMAYAFLTADAQNRTSQALALSLASTGVSIFLNVSLVELAEHPPAWSGLLAIPDSVALVAMLEWLLGVRRTLPAARNLNTRFGDRILRVGQRIAMLYSVFSIAAPDWRIHYFMRAGEHPEVIGTWQFWLFSLPIELSGLTALVAIGLLLNRRPERNERVRVIAMAAAVPFFLAGFVLPYDWASISCVLGEIILMVGATRYYMVQGQRGQFMARFLSPDVARLVAERGLSTAMQENQLEITIVSCDLRGFTAYARVRPSKEVLQVLREYYDAVGAVVGEFGGTIKDYAGDGILVLVGAPLPLEDHAKRGVDLARRIREVCSDAAKRWSADGVPIGIGVGVASGVVTVGVIGSALQLEYTAVGSAVNLASRLCEQAANGEILLDARTQSLADAPSVVQRTPLRVKGFEEPVQLYAVPA